MLARKAALLLILASLVFQAGGAAPGYSENTLDAVWSNPRFDGLVSPGEYPSPGSAQAPWNQTAQLSFYVGENASFFLVGVRVPGPAPGGNNSILIGVAKVSPTLRTGDGVRRDDYLILVNRSGLVRAVSLRGAPPPPVTAKVRAVAGNWSLELAVPYSTLELQAGVDREIGLLINAPGVSGSVWPEDGNASRPSTWGVVSSSYSWGSVSLVLENVFIFKGSGGGLLSGQNATVRVLYRNDGSIPLQGVELALYVDGQRVKTLQDPATVVPDPSSMYHKSIIDFWWRAVKGTHNITVVLDPGNVYYEANKTDNRWVSAVEIRPAVLTVRAVKGVNITAGSQAKPTDDEGVARFDVDVGRLSVTVQERVEVGEARSVFLKWGNEETSRTLQVDVQGDTTLEAVYAREFFTRLRFLDGAGNQVTPENVSLALPGGRGVFLRDVYDTWLREGVVQLARVMWRGVDVKPVQGGSTQVAGPGTWSITVRVYDLTITVRDPLGLPIAGATVTLTLANGSTVTKATGQDGRAVFAQLPLGTYTGTVQSYWATVRLEPGNAAVRPELTVQVAASISMLIIFAVIVAATGALAFAMLRMIRRPPAPRTAPYPPPG